MKTRSLIITLLVALIFAEPTQSQEYFPFPTDSATWSVACSQFDTYPYPHTEYFTSRYFLFGDTVIEPYVYSKVYAYCSGTLEIDTTNASLIGGIREDSLKHIYYRPITSNPCLCYHCSLFEIPFEFILYRFDIKLGDTVQPGNDVISLPSYTVEEVDSLLVDSYYRKRYLMVPVSAGYSRYWIEGIGSDMGFFGPSCSPFEGDVELLCYEDQQTYYNPGGEACYLWTYVSVPESEFSSDINVSPNPVHANESITIEGFIQKPVTISLYTMTGKRCQQIVVDALPYNMRITVKKGIYILSVKTKEGKSTIQKLIIY